MNRNPFVWVEIYVQDMPRAKAFYEKVFGIALSKGNPIGLHSMQ
jgi:predicted enzyme related to lactoylglutathione lyase